MLNVKMVENALCDRGMDMRYNILITPSNELFNQSLVVMMSAIVNCKYPCCFYIMQRTWTEQQKLACRTFISDYPQNTVEFIEVNENDFESFVPWKKRFGTYYKLLAHLYLPESVDRILYMDCDSFINKDIYNYYAMDFEDNYLIGSTETLSLQFYHKIRQQGLEKHGYMNGGVVLLNIKKLRETNITKETYLNAVSKFDGNYFADQGIVSYVFDGKIKLLPSYKYNHLLFQEGTREQRYTYQYVFSLDSDERRKQIVEPYWEEKFDNNSNETIVHFAGVNVDKPWQCAISIQHEKIRLESIPHLNRTHLNHSVVDRYYLNWWNIAFNLPKKYFTELVMAAKDYAVSMFIESRMLWSNNLIDYLEKLCCDFLENKRFERFIKKLHGKSVSILKVQDRMGCIFRKYADFYGANIIFTSTKHHLNTLSDEEWECCKMADIIVCCCVHGTKTHEREGIVAISVWDILQGEK